MARTTAILGRNLSRTEMALSLLAIATIVALFFDRLDAVEAAAEETMLNARLQDMRSRLVEMRVDILRNGEGSDELDIDDVIRRMAPNDTLVVSREYQIDWGQVAPGQWVFVRETGALMYRVASTRHFSGASGEPPRVRFQLETQYADTSGNKAQSGRLTGARLLRAAR